MCRQNRRYPVENTEKMTLLPGKDSRWQCGRRKKIWQLDTPFHCSIIGTCLSVKELKLLSRKLGVGVQAPLTDYALHQSFVAIAKASSYATRRLNKFLDQKYRALIRRFSRVHVRSELAGLWEAAMTGQELAGAYWALLTHPSASAELLDRMYGDIHMLSHSVVAGRHVETQELHRLQGLNNDLYGQLSKTQSRAHAQIAEKEATIRQLREALLQTQVIEKKLKETQQRLVEVEREPGLLQLKEQLAEAAIQSDNLRQQAEHAESKAKEWQQRFIQQDENYESLQAQTEALRAERDAMEAALDKILSPDCQACEEQDRCASNKDLCGRCILYVGGRTRQCARFRVLVEQQNGRFIHHDGGLHDGPSRLNSILPQADIVLCPLDCVSHDAANRVKQFCKYNGKKLILLPRSSLAAFVQGLNDIAA